MTFLHPRLPGFTWVFLTLATASPVRAELTWSAKTVELQGDAGSPVLEARFPFTNSGSTPVEIRNVESSCGCTTAALEKRSYRPGEAGEIVAKYTVGAHTGLQRKTLLVVTDDGREPATLTLVAHIREILRVEPTAATWMHNESTAPKRIALELLQETPIEEITVVSSNPRVTANVVAVTKGKKYELVVAPDRTDAFLYAKLTIRCRFHADEKSFIAYATVRPPSGER